MDDHEDRATEMRLPGRPPVRRDVEWAFWRKIAEGLTSEDAAVACGVSGPVGMRWFRERGGMPLIELDAPTGRYLSFAEREEIALLRSQKLGGPRDRPPSQAGPLDDLPRAAPQRRDSRRPAGLPRLYGPMEGGAGRGGLDGPRS